jgi:hypothetical protein
VGGRPKMLKEGLRKMRYQEIDFPGFDGIKNV